MSGLTKRQTDLERRKKSLDGGHYWIRHRGPLGTTNINLAMSMRGRKRGQSPRTTPLSPSKRANSDLADPDFCPSTSKCLGCAFCILWGIILENDQITRMYPLKLLGSENVEKQSTTRTSNFCISILSGTQIASYFFDILIHLNSLKIKRKQPVCTTFQKVVKVWLHPIKIKHAHAISKQVLNSKRIFLQN